MSSQYSYCNTWTASQHDLHRMHPLWQHAMHKPASLSHLLMAAADCPYSI